MRSASPPTAGTGALLSQNSTPTTQGALSAQILTAIRRTTEQMVSSQAAQKLPLDEKLRGVQILDVTFDRQTLRFFLKLGFESMAGEQGVADVGLGE